MIKEFLLGISLLCLVNCSNPTEATTSLQSGMDNYYFTSKEYEKKEVTIKIVLYQNYDDLGKAGKKHGLNPSNDEYIVAFSLDRLKGNKCEIHILDPMIQYRPEFIGHEVAHCFFGQFHGSNDSKG